MGVIVPRYMQNGDLINPSFSPYVPLRIKWTNKFTRNLIVCCVPGQGSGLDTINLVDGSAPVSTTGSINIDASHRGKELSGSAGAFSYDVTGQVDSTSFSMFSLMRRTVDTSANMPLMSVGSNASSNDRMELHCRGQTAGDPYNLFYKLGGTSIGIRQGSMVFNEFRPIMMTRYNAANTFLNVTDGAFSDAGSISAIAVDRVAFMGHNYGGTWDATDMGLLIGAVWSAPLSQSYINEFMTNPFQILEFV